MLWLCLRCTDLALAAVGVVDPDLPQVVAEGQRVHCPNQAAVAGGVVAGMVLANARALCPGLALLPRAPAQEQTILEALAHACHHLTPKVTLCPPAALLLEISGSLKLFGGLAALLAAVRDTLRLQQVHAAIGAAPTPAAAQLLSHGDADPLDYLDAHSGALTRPRAFTRRLHALPLTALDCAPELVEKLARTGLRRVGEVLQLPGSALGRRYGRDFVHYLERIRGQRPDPRTTMPLASSFSRRLEFGAGIERAEMLLFPARRLLHELSGYLRARQMHCGRLNWTLYQEHGAPLTLPLRLARPRGDLAHLLELTRLGFATLRLEGPVAALALASDELHPAQGTSGDLLSTLVPQPDPAGIQTLCDRLAARLGPGVRKPPAAIVPADLDQRPFGDEMILDQVVGHCAGTIEFLPRMLVNRLRAVLRLVLRVHEHDVIGVRVLAGIVARVRVADRFGQAVLRTGAEFGGNHRIGD